MKIFILFVACFFLGVFVGYYYRDASVEGEIREEMFLSCLFFFDFFRTW